MADIVSKTVRSRMMSGIQGKNTKPEVVIRRGLFKRGYRFRIHYNKLPGKPDIALPKYRALIRVHGCFWHGHDCHLFKWPSTRPEFWREKINGNISRDIRHKVAYHESGWRVLSVWECALKGVGRYSVSEVLDSVEDWLINGDRDAEITGKQGCNSTG